MRCNSSKLLIVFGGWGSDGNILRAVIKPHRRGCDIMACYNYTDLEFDHSVLKEYEEIEVVGWSFGVWIASQIMVGVENISASTAINGTHYPIDNLRGIPTEIFDATLSNFSAATLSKFRRRMCGSSQGVKSFLDLQPLRSVESLQLELAALRNFVLYEPQKKSIKWHRAIVGTKDMIIPTENQLRAWRDTDTEIIQIEEPHFYIFNI